MSSIVASAAPSSALVIRREKRRRRKNTTSERPTSGKRQRRGFVFGDAPSQEEDEDRAPWRPAPSSPPPAPTGGDSAFVFRAKRMEKSSKRHGVDTNAASAALISQRERAEKEEKRRQRLRQKKEDSERDARLEKQVQATLNADQVELYQHVASQVKRELRKTKKQFANSAGRDDVVSLTEKTFRALKEELIAFMSAGPPTNAATKRPNPETARLRAMIDTHDKQMAQLDEEEQQWIELKARVEADKAEATRRSARPSSEQSVQCELKVTQSIAELQQSAIQRFGATTQQLDLLEASMATIDQLVIEAEAKKAKLFGAFHAGAFKGYAHMAEPKENLRALLQAPPPGPP